MPTPIESFSDQDHLFQLSHSDEENAADRREQARILGMDENTSWPQINTNYTWVAGQIDEYSNKDDWDEITTKTREIAKSLGLPEDMSLIEIVRSNAFDNQKRRNEALGFGLHENATWKEINNTRELITKELGLREDASLQWINEARAKKS